MEDPSFIPALKSGNKKLNDYLIENLPHIFGLAFDFSNIPLSNKALTVLTNNNLIIYEQILDNNLLQTEADKILGSPIENVSMNRLAMISKLCFLNNPSLALSRCNFLPKMINSCYIRSVYDMFANILGTQPTCSIIQEGLKETGFVDSLIKCLQEIPSSFSDDILSEQQTTWLFNLVPLVKNSFILRESISTKESLEVISRKFDSCPISILNAQWNAISAVVSAKNAECLLSRLSSMIDMLKVGGKSTFNPYQEYVLITLGVMTENLEAARTRVIQENLSQILNEIVLAYPNHSIALNTVSNYFVSTIKYPTFCIDMIRHVLISVNVGFQNNASISHRSFSWLFVKTYSEHFNEVPGLEELFKSKLGDGLNKVSEINHIVDNPYGGDTPQTNNEGQLSAEQIEKLLRFLTEMNNKQK